MNPVSVIVGIVTVVASLGAIVLVALLMRKLLLSRHRAREATPSRTIAAASTWQERAALYEASGQYADYKCPYLPHDDNSDDSVVIAEKP